MQSSDLSTVIQHYTAATENTRLTTPSGQLEFQRSLQLIRQTLPAAPCVVLDVGGAAGVYSIALASQGYEVHLIDPVEKHVQQAIEASRVSSVKLGGATVGDARQLQYASNSVDAVLMMGPLYHLTNEEDRIAALCEAYRVLKPGGVLFAIGISRFGSLLDGLARNLFADPVFEHIVEQDLDSGQHRNPTDNQEYFTDAFLHLPSGLASEVEHAGFVVEIQHGIEGPAWLLADLAEWMIDEKRRTLLMSLLDRVSTAESLIGASAHFATVARKPLRRNLSVRLKNCEIRAFHEDDAESLQQNANDPEIASRLRDGFPHPYTLSDAHWWIRQANKQDPFTSFAIAVDGKVAGGCGIILQSDVSARSAEIGYWLGRNYWGRGIATEVVRTITEYAFDTFDLNRVYAMVFEGNEASARVLEKAGYEFEGRLRKAVYKNGRVLDQFAYAIVR